MRKVPLARPPQLSACCAAACFSVARGHASKHPCRVSAKYTITLARSIVVLQWNNVRIAVKLTMSMLHENPWQLQSQYIDIYQSLRRLHYGIIHLQRDASLVIGSRSGDSRGGLGGSASSGADDRRWRLEGGSVLRPQVRSSNAPGVLCDQRLLAVWLLT